MAEQRLIDANEVHNLVRNAKKYMWCSPISSDRKVTVSTDDIQFGVDKIPTKPEAIHEPTASEFKRMAVQMGYEPVRHGHWTDENGNKTGQFRFNFMCSNCKQHQHSPVAINGEDFAKKHKYCHNCGAKMCTLEKGKD